MPIRMENNSVRKSYRIPLPATVEIEDQIYTVYDWSLQGFKASVPKGTLPPGWDGQVAFILPLQHMNVSFRADAELRRQEDESAGFAFKELPKQTKSILSKYVQASIEGTLDDVEGVIVSAETAVSPVITETPLNFSERQQFKHRFWGRMFLLVPLILLAVLLIGFILYNNFSKVRSTRAVISGGLIDIAPEISGYLTSVDVKDNQTIHKGDLLFTLDDRDMLRQIENFKQIIAVEKKKLKSLKVDFQEEQKSMDIYRKAAQSDSERYQSDIDGVSAQIDAAQKEYDRAQMLLSDGAVSKSYWDQRRKELLSLKAQREALRAQLRLANENIVSTDNGKYLSDGKAHGHAQEIEAQVKVQKQVVAQKELELSQALSQLEKTRIVSTVDGTVYTVKRQPGTYLRAGESVMAIHAMDVRPWVLARFTFEEAQRLAPGANATVYFPSINEYAPGIVQALGHQALGIRDAVSQDQEISLSEVPAKIMLVYVPKGIEPGIGATVSIDTPWLQSLKSLL
ncbi:biotin/lipoyl-binding protein [Desulfovibrio inopinatus]|uniref:biotin/lipoyl-binding protein n=1 Tax=Desulfovibrio inopinatus TaxID=102109 RepID=UPI0004803954|nr:biotin/lipoyl-binding protein [Desulfovibrio inopinatus]